MRPWLFRKNNAASSTALPSKMFASSLPIRTRKRGAVVSGLGDGMIVRGDVEDWLAEMARLEAKERAATLRWARIASWAGVVLVRITVLEMIPDTVFVSMV